MKSIGSDVTYFCLLSDSNEMLLGKTKGHSIEVFPKLFTGFIGLSGPRNCNVFFGNDNFGLYEIFDRWCHDQFTFKESIKSDSWLKMNRNLIHTLFGAHKEDQTTDEMMLLAKKYCSGYMAKDLKPLPDNNKTT